MSGCNPLGGGELSGLYLDDNPFLPAVEWRLIRPIEGADVGPEIQAALEAGEDVYLAAGTHLVGATIEIPSGRRVRGSPGDTSPSIVAPHPSFAPSTADADVPTNALFSCRATVATPSTTLSSDAKQFATSLALADTSGLSSGDLIVVSGTNYGHDHYAGTDAEFVTKTEVCEIDAVVSSTVVDLARPTSQHHGQGSSVARITSRRADVEITDLTLNAEGGTIANGILLDHVERAKVHVRGAGFSRALLEHRLGGHGLRARLRADGELNCAILLDSVHESDVVVTCSGRGKRVHDHGTVRGLVTERRRCNGTVIHDSLLAHHHCGYVKWGGTNTVLRDTIIRDMDGHARASRTTEIYTSSGMGSGISTTDGPLADFETIVGFVVDNVRLEDCRCHYPGGGGAPTQMGAIFAWCRGLRVRGLELVNTGPASGGLGTATSEMRNGALFATSMGQVDGLETRGVENALRVAGDANLAFSSVMLDAVNGEGGGAVGAWLDGGTIRVARLSVAGFSQPLATSVDPPPDVWIDWLDLAGVPWSHVRAAKNTTGATLAMGEVAETSSASGSLVLVSHTTLTGERKAVAVQSTSNGTWGWVGLIGAGPQTVLAGSGAVVIGDLLEMATAGHQVSAQANATHPLGRALGAKSAGAAGLVLMGPCLSSLTAPTSIPLTIGTTPVLTAKATGVDLGAATVQFSQGVSSPTVTQEGRTSDAACNALLVASQAPYASATTNKDPGKLVLRTPSPVSGGASQPVEVQVDGATTRHKFERNMFWVGVHGSMPLQIGPRGGDPSQAYGAIHAGSGAPSVYNWQAMFNGSNAYVQALSGSVQLWWGSGYLLSQLTSYGGATLHSLYDLSTLAATDAFDATGTCERSFAATVTAIKLTGGTRTTDAAPADVTITTGQPYGSATTNKTPGSLIEQLGAPSNGGTTFSRELLEWGTANPPRWARTVATKQTANETTAVAMSFTPEDGSVVGFLVCVTARRASNGDSAVYVLHTAAKRVSGTTTELGAEVTDVFEDAGAAGWSVAVAANSPALEVQVTGERDATIDWTVFLMPMWRVS